MIRALRLAVVFGLVVLTGCPTRAIDGSEVPTLMVKRTDQFVRRVTAEGYLKAIEATPIQAPQEARRPMKISWIAPDGGEIAEGDVVVRFDDSEMERMLKDSEADVKSAEHQIAKEQVLGKTARQKRDRAAGHADVEVVAAKEFEADEDDKILSRNEIIESRIDVELSTAKAEHSRKVKRVERSVSKSKLGVHGIARTHATSEVERAKQGLAHLEVKAPHAGILVIERDWRGNTLRVGDSVWRGQKIGELPLVTALEAELLALEADAGDLAVGLEAEVVVEAHPNTTYQATVKRVDTLAKPRHEDVPVQYFGVTLELERTDNATMKVGQRVRATITIDHGDSLVVPRQAVFEREGRTFVFRANGDGFEQVDVELGASSAGRVVVASGLEENDRIALRDPNKAAAELLADDPSARPAGEKAGKG